MAYRVLSNKQVIHSNLFLPFSNEVKNCTVMKNFTDNMLVVGVLPFADCWSCVFYLQVTA